jgi:uncharacterized repeat protein (TIGR01451 family)
MPAQLPQPSRRRRWARLGAVLGLSAALGLLLSLAPGRPALPAPLPAGPTAARDVVINEVAWSGTEVDATDEWIELYNTTPATVSLDGWHLIDDDNLNLALAGDIGPHGYYLIERSSDATVSDVPADLVTGFGNGLNNDGEPLTLTNALGHVVDTANAPGGTWPAGTHTPNASMERVDTSLPDRPENWATNDGITINGHDAVGNPIIGTPRARNSAYVIPWAQRAELVAHKAGPHTTTAGARITYTLTLSNEGGHPAHLTTLTDTLPAAVTFVTQTTTVPFTRAGHVLVWHVGTVPTATSRVLTVTGRVSASAVGPLTNRITATTVTTELHRLDNTARWTTTLRTPRADLGIAKSGPVTVAAQGYITYHLTFSNSGPVPATATRITDVVPPGLDVVAQTSAFTFTEIGRTLVWACGDVVPGDAGHITMTARAQAGTVGSVTNHVTATTTAPEANPGDNAAAWSVIVGDAAPHVLIAGVLYDGYQANDADEAVRLVNVGAVPADLTGWELCKDAGGTLSCRTLPTLTLPARAHAWLARDAAAFAASFGHPPDLALGSWLLQGLSNDGDEVVLRDAQGAAVDAVAFAAGTTAITGWDGAAVQPYAVGREEGQILARIPDEVTGLPLPDTDTQADWIQTPDDPLRGRQVRYPGWDMDPLFWPLQVTERATVVVGIAPDNAFEVISRTLMQAREHITVEVYTFRHPALIDAVLRKAQAGVQVTLLLEGSPLGVGADAPEWQTELWACEQLEATGNGACWFMVSNESHPNIHDRYRYIHAKLMIVDDTWAVIGSQNFTRSSLPSDDKTNGTYGSRGVVVATTAPSVVARARRIVALDLGEAGAHADILRWNANHTGDFYGKYGPPAAAPDLDLIDGITYTVRFTEPLVVHGTFAFELLSAPEAALRHSDALLGLVRRAGAGDAVYVEQMYEHVMWGDAGNPRLRAYIDAARRGAEVHILVNGKSFAPYGGPPLESRETVSHVNRIARAEDLDLRAAMGDVTGSGIHNKMVLVRLQGEGSYIHVGSINGSESSSKVNREIALQIGAPHATLVGAPAADPALYGYLEELMTFDWHQSQPMFMPLLVRDYTPPAPPVTYPVISEVYYRASTAGEWVEVYNPTRYAVDLSAYKLGDAEAPGAFEPMFRFPTTTTLAPQDVLIVAINASEVPEADYEVYESDPDVPNMVPYPRWGDQGYPFALRNDGDQVLLLGPDDAVVDVVVWGDKSYPGHRPHPGVLVSTSTLERYPPYYDTDDCAIDFRERTPGTPGTVPEVP